MSSTVNIENIPPLVSGRVIPVTRNPEIMASNSSLAPVLVNESRQQDDDDDDEHNHQDTDNQPDENHSTFVNRLSPKRWFVLLAISYFGLAHALAGDTSPILNLILKLMDLRVDKYMYITQTFYYAMAIMALPTAWFVDHYGIRVAITSAGGLFLANTLFKTLLYMPNLPAFQAYKFYYFIISCVINTQLMAMFFLLPLKVSETWFSARERTVAWTVMFATMDTGICVGSFVYPRIMQDLNHIYILAYINLIAGITTLIVILFSVTSAAPEHPPSERMARASKDKTPFLITVKRMLTTRDILLQLIHSAIFESCTLTVAVILQDILISAGFSKIFAGNFMSINALVAIVMLIVMATLVHKVNNITLACKLGSASQTILFIMYLTALLYRAPGWAVVLVSIILNACKSWTTPNYANMVAHLACGVVSQATIVGFSMSSTVITMTVIQLTFVRFMKLSTGSHETNDYSHSLMFLMLVCIINELIYLIFFQGRASTTKQDDDHDDHHYQNQERHIGSGGDGASQVASEISRR